MTIIFMESALPIANLRARFPNPVELEAIKSNWSAFHGHPLVHEAKIYIGRFEHPEVAGFSDDAKPARGFDKLAGDPLAL